MHARKKGLFKKKAPQSGEMALQITSMADIFTILLVFLLKGFSTGAVAISPSSGLMLPEAQGAEAVAEALKIEISEKAIQVEGQAAAPLTNFRYDEKSILPNGVLKDLGASLEKERKRQLMIAQNNSDVKVDSKVMIIADQRVPYSTIKAVLASAAVNGFTDFKLVTARAE